MSIEITGKVVQLGQRQTGQSAKGTWVKQELIIETEDQFPKKVCLICWGDKADEAAAFTIGERIKASINIESREYNGRWYTDVKPWRFERDGAAKGAVNQGDSMPPPNYEESAPDSEEGDLPF